MATGVTRISDVIVPAIFTPYVQNLTMEKSALIASGAVVSDAAIAQLLAGGGLTFNVPAFKDLDNDAENTSTDDPAQLAVPNKIGTLQEIAVRMNRNQSWSSMNLTAQLAGADPMQAIANRVAAYWTRRLQAAFVATMGGIFADNAAAPAGGDTHVQNDLTRDVSGASYVAGTTDFSANSFIDAVGTMGDSMGELTLIAVHSITYQRMQKNNLIDFIPDAEGRINIPTFLGRRVIIDDGMPNAAGVFQSWLFGSGAVRFGQGNPPEATETKREALAGNGSGQDILINRVEWSMHPVGYQYIGTAPAGGPSNAATANNLAAAGSWRRIYPERKQIKIARLVTREF